MKSEREVVRHVRHVGGGKLALYEGDTLVRHLGDTLLHFRDRDEMIVAWNAALSASVPGEAVDEDSLCATHGCKAIRHKFYEQGQADARAIQPTPAVSASVVTEEMARRNVKLLYGFMLECNVIGAKEAGVNLAHSIKDEIAALERAP